jgi:uncharacterized protein (DUF433 family)
MMDWRERIHSNPDVMGGKPVVRGTRITVELILEYFEDGASVGDILEAYPHVREDDVRAAVSFAREMLHDEASIAQRRAA